MAVIVEKDKCIACGACVGSCPFGAIEMSDSAAMITDKCTECGACIESCPVEAISRTDVVESEVFSLDAYKGVWVFAEQRDCKVMNIAFELLGEGKKLADSLGVELGAVLIGDNVADKAQELFAYGADVVYLVEDPALKNYRTESYTAVIEDLVKTYKPEIILIGATNIGRDLGPRLAGRIHTGLTADCTELAIDPETRLLMQTRPAFGGNIMATILCPNTRPQMSTVRPGVMKKATPDNNCSGKVVKVKYDAAAEVRTIVKEIVREASKVVNLEEAQVIVSGGRGVGGPEGFKVLQQLVDEMGGMLGASRGAVDSGWIPANHQVGQTGKTVHPKIYVACGISGAIQHVAGMQNAACIIAINKNPGAAIFKVADYGIVGDYAQVIPMLIEAIKEIKAEGGELSCAM